MAALTPVRTFISHAGKDKDRFVLRLAERLRGNGVEVWLDHWEMNLGDNLIQKIFEEGLENTDVVIAVISDNSLKSKWVKDEIYTAKAQQINGLCRLIPVVLDGCPIPEALRATLYTEIEDTDNYESQYDAILRAIYSKYEKPPLGPPPSFVASSSPIYGLDLTDSLVLRLACEQARSNGPKGSPQVGASQIMEQAKALNISEDAMWESLEVLSEKHHIDTPYRGEHIHWFAITAHGWRSYSRAYMPNYDELLRSVAARIVNDGDTFSTDISEALGINHLDVVYALGWFAGQGYFKQIASSGRAGKGVENEIGFVSTSLKRWLRDQ